MKKFLKKWYCEKGPVWCSEQLGKKSGNVQQMAHKLGLNYRKARQERIRGYLLERLLSDGWRRAAEGLGLSEGKVRLWAKKFGVEGPPDDRGAKPIELTKEQERMVLEGYPVKSPWLIAKEIGLGGETVKGFLERRGLYQGYGRRVSWSVDRDFFRWSNDFAYVFGYMCADGSVGEYSVKDKDGRGRRKLAYCSITSKDEGVLRDIGKRMGLRSKPYSYVKVKNRKTGEKGKYWCLRTSCRWVFDRWIEYGLKPRKSYVGIGVPNVPEEFLKHFVRGFFDGDGSKSKNGYSVSFGCTDEKFMDWLRNIVVRVVGGNVPKMSVLDNPTIFFSFVVCADRAKKLLKWMEPGESDLRLERKWKIS